MITESTVIKASILTAGVSFAGTPAVINHLPIFTNEHELTTVLWLIGGMLGVVVMLLGAVCWFVRDMRNSNKAQHTLLFTGVNTLASDLSNLQGQHAAAFNAQGCAYDSERLQNMITDSIIVALSEVDHSTFSDCQNYSKVGNN